MQINLIIHLKFQFQNENATGRRGWGYSSMNVRRKLHAISTKIVHTTKLEIDEYRTHRAILAPISVQPHRSNNRNLHTARNACNFVYDFWFKKP